MSYRRLISTAKPLWRSLFLATVIGVILLATAPGQPLIAAPFPTVSGAELNGQLAGQYSAHYFGLETTERDAIIVLTLAYQPQDNPDLQGFVNFLVLTEEGLRLYLDGGDLKTLSIASGSPLQFDPIGNKVRAAFRDSGRGRYTVIVYNNSTLPIEYTLSARSGILHDDAGQTVTAPAAAPEATTNATNTPTQTVAAPPAATSTSTGLNTVRARRVSGDLGTIANRHFLSLQPGERDAQMALHFTYDPQDQPALIGNVNFWLLDEDRLRRMANGEDVRDINLAAGFPVPFNPFLNQLQASFRASGYGPYTLLVYNQATLPASYTLAVEGGLIIDPYGQTNEARAAAVELAAVTAQANAAAPVTNPLTNTVQTTISTPISQTAAQAVQDLVFGVEKIAGALTQPYQHHYLGLTPEINNGIVTLTLDFDRKDSQVLRENLNFWVMTEESLRLVINGARPQDVGLATGAVVEFGPDEGKLRAVFNASGHGKYTVVVFNNSDVAVRYLLTAEGGLLVDETGQTSLP